MSRRWFPLSPRAVERIRAGLNRIPAVTVPPAPAPLPPAPYLTPPLPPLPPMQSSSYIYTAGTSFPVSTMTFSLPPGSVVFPSGTASVTGFTPETPDPVLPDLPVVEQEDLLQGTKYAILSMGPDGKPCFRGTGYTDQVYQTETRAVCGRHENHSAPGINCTCGFWVPRRKESRLSMWNKGRVALEVEMAGTVLECWPDTGWKGSPESSGPPWGYRAEWQRVLSVALHHDCEMSVPDASRWKIACNGPPKYLCGDWISGTYCTLKTACDVHVNPGTLVPRPVSWLRENLRTEIRPGTVTDDPPPPVTGLELLTQAQLDIQFREETKRITDKMVPMSQLSLPPASPGYWHSVVNDGIQYTYEATISGWEIRRITTPLLDNLSTAIAVTNGLNNGLITARQAMELLKGTFEGIQGIGG